MLSISYSLGPVDDDGAWLQAVPSLREVMFLLILPVTGEFGHPQLSCATSHTRIFHCRAR